MNVNEYVKSMLKSTRESTVGIELDMRFDVVEFIKRNIAETGLTQKQMAAKMKMKDSQLTRILNAESNLTLETVARIFHVFGRKPQIIEQYIMQSLIAEDNNFVRQIASEPISKEYKSFQIQ